MIEGDKHFVERNALNKGLSKIKWGGINYISNVHCRISLNDAWVMVRNINTKANKTVCRCMF